MEKTCQTYGLDTAFCTAFNVFSSAQCVPLHTFIFMGYHSVASVNRVMSLWPIFTSCTEYASVDQRSTDWRMNPRLTTRNTLSEIDNQSRKRKLQYRQPSVISIPSKVEGSFTRPLYRHKAFVPLHVPQLHTLKNLASAQ